MVRFVRDEFFLLQYEGQNDAALKRMERGYKFPEVTSWIRASKKTLNW